MVALMKIISSILVMKTAGHRAFIHMKRESIKKQFEYVPKSANQQKYADCLNNLSNKLIVVLGPAGTGKTLFACKQAINELKSGTVDKIVLTRPIVSVEEELGFLPGNINKKMDPWTRPMFDLFLEYYTQKEIDSMMNAGTVEISPIGYMRGRTFKNCFIICDEMQNSSPNQMLMAVTRIGFGSRMVITGDLNQSDKGSLQNGLADFTNKIRSYSSENKNDTPSIRIVELEKSDVERSKIVSKVLDIYDFKPFPKVASFYETNSSYSNEAIKSNKQKVGENDAALIPASHYFRTL
jgi:phosphate starvation-inducible PhoH-like protein